MRNSRRYHLSFLPCHFIRSPSRLRAISVILVPDLALADCARVLKIQNGGHKTLNRCEDSLCTHCYCASLVRTLYMTWRVLRHVFQARAPNGNSTKYRADDRCGNLICEYFCWMLGDPHFFFGRSLPFLILSIILKNKKNLYVGSFNYFSYTIQIGSQLIHG